MIDDHLEMQGDEETAGGSAATPEGETRDPVTAPFAAPAPATAPADEEPEAEGSETEEEPLAVKAEAPTAELEEPANPKLKWYAVHTYSGHENKVRTNLLKRIAVEDLEWEFGHVLVPTEEVTEMKQGKKTVSNRKYFPSYILVEMEMCDRAYHLVNQISGVTRFVGLDQKDNSKRPVALRPHEVDRILGRIERPTEHKVSEIPYMVGDHIHVIDGPFSDFNGVVDDVNPERGTLKVMVTIFGRETPVELDFLQVEPI